MSLSRRPAPLLAPSATPELKPSARGKTIATRLPKPEMEAVERAAEGAGKTCAEWLRDAALAHLRRPAPGKQPPPDPVLLAELLALRSLTQNLIAAASDLSEETVRKIARHADAVKHGKAEEILHGLAAARPEAK